jgi:hypothetical protein
MIALLEAEMWQELVGVSRRIALVDATENALVGIEICLGLAGTNVVVVPGEVE